MLEDVRTSTNVVIRPSPQGLEHSGRYAEEQASAFYFPWSWARNLQELINSTTGEVLAPKVQPGTHQVMALLMGWIFCPNAVRSAGELDRLA